jgi:hypothetical protein
MKPYIILFKPRSLDDNIELEIVYETTETRAMFKWLEENKNTGKHYSGYLGKPLNNEQEILFKEDYVKFKKEFYKPSPFFGYD